MATTRAAAAIRRPSPSGMRRGLLAGLLIVLILALALRAGPPPASPVAAKPPPAAAAPGFEPNRGRMPSAVDFAATSPAGAVALTDRGLAVSREEEGRTGTLRMVLPGAELGTPAGEARRATVVNDLRGDDPERWRTGIPTFGRVRYAGAYPGIDVVYRAERSGIEYEFRLEPGADPAAIRLAFPGASGLRVRADGALGARRDGMTFRQSPPVAFQPGPHGRVPVAAAFSSEGDGIGFELGGYDPGRPLVIDPVVFDYSTYLGGSDDDLMAGVVAGPGGTAYVAGSTASTDFNAVGGIEGDDDSYDVFVARLNAAGDGLDFSTYLGGDGFDSAAALDVGPSGGIYVTGYTNSTDFDTVGEIEGDSPGTADAFVSKIAPAGDALVYSTYLGGDNGDYPGAIAVDATGAAYVAGSTYSSDFDTRDPIAGDAGGQDGFVTKLNPAGDDLVYSTYLGGGGNDLIAGIAVRGGAAYFAGYSDSSDFPTNDEIEGDAGGRDAVAGKLNRAGDALTWSTYLAGSDDDDASAIAVDGDGSAYIAGDTRSPDFDQVNPIEGPSGTTDADAFVTKLAPAGDALEYSTYLGGSDGDFARAIAVGADGSAHVAGQTSSADFDRVGELQPPGGDSDAFVSSLSPDGGQLLFSTLLGGGDIDLADGVAVDATALYVAGTTFSGDFPTAGGIEGDDLDEDGFVTKLVTKPYLETTIAAGPAEGAATADATPTFEFASTGAPAGYECRFDAAAFSPCTSPHTPAELGDGDHTFEVRAVGGRLTDPTPAARAFAVDTTAPNTHVTKWPKAKQRRLERKHKRVELKFAWDSDDRDAAYECRFDKADYKRCVSPKRKKLDRGKHTLRVRATDALGNREGDPVVRKLEVKKAKKKKKGRG